MPRLRWSRIGVLLLCVGFSLAPMYFISRNNRVEINTIDFQQLYYGSGCVLHHQNPYDPNSVLKDFRTTIGAIATDRLSSELHPPILVDVYLPTTLFLVAPLAMLPWGVAQALWIALTAGLLVASGYLVWSLAEGTAPDLSGLLVCLILANCQHLFVLGNPAGVAVSLCIIATWCFLGERYAWGGVLLLGASLLLKPHDAGFIWLFFLLTGGIIRKRALQTLALTCVIGILAAIWIAPSSEHWIQELHRNHVAVSEVGGSSDPALSGSTSGRLGAILDLQAPLSLIVHNPQHYNFGSFLIAGSLILAWAFFVSRERFAPERSLLAIAAIAALSLLPVYHRPNDAKLLMLTIPACALLWAQGGARRWLAFVITLAGILLISDLPLSFLSSFTQTMYMPMAIPAYKSVAISVLPPLTLLAMGCFYLWMFISFKPLALTIQDGVAKEHDLASTSEQAGQLSSRPY